jgi:hypothetical protein
MLFLKKKDSKDFVVAMVGWKSRTIIFIVKKENNETIYLLIWNGVTTKMVIKWRLSNKSKRVCK